MKRGRMLPELLAPAGSFDALIAAVLGGADAVYLGGLRFGARAFAKNFDEEELSRAVRVCHMFGVRIYVTLNTLIFDKELDEAIKYAKTLHGMGVDALIVADIGVADMIKREVPGLELHASTQMGAHNIEGVNFAKRLGCSRVVLARECSFQNIRDITEKSEAECEVFVHGALCVCHSGQCLFSSMVGGRSGNRGECAQPCRLPYNSDKYPLSLRDLSLSNHINELIDSGVSSLKIEGRMKSPFYVYEVTRIYRALLDGHRCASFAENKRLADIFSRDGFTDGYFKGELFSKMTGTRTEDAKAKTKDIEHERFSLPKVRVSAEARFVLGEPSELAIEADLFSRWDNAPSSKENSVCSKIKVSVKGEVPTRAENSPLTEEGVKARLSKMGSTPFELALSDIKIELEEGINLPPSAINALRRDAAARLEAEYGKSLDELCDILSSEECAGLIVEEESRDSGDKKNIKTALFFDTDTLSELVKIAPGELSLLNTVFVPLHKYFELQKEILSLPLGVYIPPVIMEHEWQTVRESLVRAVECGVSQVLVANISHIALVRECGGVPIGDFRLNVTNSHSFAVWRALGVRDIILSPELTLPMARDIGGGVITLGRIPLMITERCFMKENFGCRRCGKVSFTDRRGMKFPIMREYEHRNVIFNSSVTYMGDKRDELRAAKISHEHFVFSSESAEECARLLHSYKSEKKLNIPHRRVGKR